jgi:transposase
MPGAQYCAGIGQAFEYLGGVPAECVDDNVRAAVARREGDRRRRSPGSARAVRP